MKIINKKIFIVYIVLIVFLLLSGCADSLNIESCRTSNIYGFWSGLWHGFIAPLSFFCRLFNDDIAIYAINNNGRWYDFGFVLGSGILGFGAGKKS